MKLNRGTSVAQVSDGRVLPWMGAAFARVWVTECEGKAVTDGTYVGRIERNNRKQRNLGSDCEAVGTSTGVAGLDECRRDQIGAEIVDCADFVTVQHSASDYVKSGVGEISEYSGMMVLFHGSVKNSTGGWLVGMVQSCGLELLGLIVKGAFHGTQRLLCLFYSVRQPQQFAGTYKVTAKGTHDHKQHVVAGSVCYWLT